MSRTCHELGVCQQRTPPCRGCESIQVPTPQKPIRFASGVIQSASRRRQHASLARWMGRALGVMLLVATIAFWAGLFSGSV